MALFDMTGQEVRSAPPLEGPYGLRSLAAELSDARVSISEAMAHPEYWGAEGNTTASRARLALKLLARLADALESDDDDTAIDAAWLEINRLWVGWHAWVPAPGLDAVVWRAVRRVRSACWEGRMAGTIWEGSKAKWPNYRDEARRLGQVCRTL